MKTADAGLVLRGVIWIPLLLASVLTGCYLIVTGELWAVFIVMAIGGVVPAAYAWMMKPSRSARDASRWSYLEGDRVRGSWWNCVASLWVMLLMLVWCVVAFWYGAQLGIESKTAGAWWSYVLAIGPCAYWAKRDWEDRDDTTALWFTIFVSIVVALAAMITLESSLGVAQLVLMTLLVPGIVVISAVSWAWRCFRVRDQSSQ